MRNIQTEIKAGKLCIFVDISDKAIKASPMSNSGKNRLVASTGGNQQVPGAPDGVRFGLNVIAK